MKLMTFSQKKIARSDLFVSEAQERYVRTVDQIMELKEKLKQLEQKRDEYEAIYDRLFHENVVIRKKFIYSRGSRYAEEYRAKYNYSSSGFEYDYLGKSKYANILDN